MDIVKAKCICKRLKCIRHGNCKACREYHRNSAKYTLTTCERLESRKNTEKNK